jgi:hypothetical protein
MSIRVVWTKLGSGEYTNGHLFVWSEHVALTSTVWWHVGTTLRGTSIRAFMKLRNAKAYASAYVTTHARRGEVAP